MYIDYIVFKTYRCNVFAIYNTRLSLNT